MWAVVARFAASATRAGLRKNAPLRSATRRPWCSDAQGRVPGEAVESPRRARRSTSALRVASRLRELESCWAEPGLLHAEGGCEEGRTVRDGAGVLQSPCFAMLVYAYSPKDLRPP